jgi:hypothetical protein
MKTENTSFAAAVPVRGFEWLPGPFAILLDDHMYKEAALIPIGNKQRAVPLPEALFLEFSDLETDEAIKQFAERFGLLGVRAPKSLCPQPDEDPADKNGEAITGELRSDWLTAIRVMNRTIKLWMAIKTADEEMLAQRVDWKGPRLIYYHEPARLSGTRRIAGDSDLINVPGHYPDLAKDDVLGRAQLCLEKIIGDNLMPYLRYAVTPTPGATDTFIKPACLYGILWYQLGEAIHQAKSVRPCAVCRTPILITPGGFRGERRTCGLNCRVKLYDDRKLLARQLQQEGVSLNKIAQRLDTTVAKIQKWTQGGDDAANLGRSRQRSGRVAAAASS